VPRLDSPIRTTTAIFIRRVVNGKESFQREMYNVVALDYGDGSPVQTYAEPICGRPLSPLERFETYSEVRIYDVPPYPGTRIGY
jgi:hypothetical protein